jgi:HEAT repeat protein
MLSRDEDPRVRASAVDGLGRTRLESVAGRLVEALGDPDPDVRRAAVGAMGEIGCCYEWILSAFDDSDTWVRVAAIKGTRAFSEPGLVPRLMDLSADPAVPVALAALETLAAISDRDGFSALTVFADHPDPDVRNRAEELLERT